MSEPQTPPAMTPKPAEDSIYRSMFSAYPDALLLVDAAGRIVLANPEAERLLGYAAGELSGLKVDALVPDAIRPRHAAYREAYSHRPKARPMGTQMELVARRRDGREVMVEIALSPLQIEGEPFVVAAVRGIEAYPRVRQALQRARYSEFVAQMGRLAVDTRDPQLLLQQVPAAAVDALQIDSAVVFLLDATRLEFHVAGGVGLLACESLGSRCPNRPDTPPGFVLAQGRVVTVADFAAEQRYTVPPDYLAHGLVSALAVPLVDRGQIIGVLAARARHGERFGADETHFLESLSNLLAASLQRSQSEEALNHAQRMESVGQLTGGIAHDFNNLLTVIQGNLQVLEDHPALALDAGAQQMVAAAARASRRGAELTGKLLAFSRRQQLSPTEVDVPELIESLADMLRRTLDQRIRIEVAAGARGLRCLADAGQLESALLNIAINSRDAMPTGGTLSFSCGICAALPADVAADLGDLARGQSFIEVVITDTGLGMTDSVRDRVFEPFFTTKELGRGTGLGMSTVYGFVKQSKGSIRLTTAPGAGTQVTLYLPRLRGAAEQEELAAQATEGLPLGLEALLVEDDADVRTVVCQFLLSLGCQVTEFDAAEPALEHLASGASCALLLTDIALGAGMRGTELARQVHARWPGVAVLLMSGYSTELLQAPEDSPSTWELLRKPYERSDLARAMARALKARPQVPSRQ
ncbi:MAG: histidine kinase [Burkholderiales bacterium PBB1]|nr:MAG: histidine kinase [Burkholderiales bacterium PBB1]